MRQNLLSGRSQSCGCLGREHQIAGVTTHGGTNSPEFKVWHGMINRCHNPNDSRYHKYGGRGITVCDEWRNDFAAFLAHVGPRPPDKDTIGRINGLRGYEPNNVRWETYDEQNINRSNVILIDGVPLAVLAKQHGIDPRNAAKRWRRGWPLEKILTTPVK
jgi:hypothetical protein